MIVNLERVRIKQINGEYRKLDNELEQVKKEIYDINIQKSLLEKKEFEIKQKIEKLEEKILLDIEKE